MKADYKDAKKTLKIESLLKEIDLILTVLFNLLSILFILIPPFNATSFRIILGFIFVFFISGYSLVAALFPIRDDLDGIERIILSFGLSIIIISLLGLILNLTSFGIMLAPMVIVLTIFTISFSVVAWFRRVNLPAEERFRAPFERLLKLNLGQSILDKGLSIILIASIIGSCITLIYVFVMPNTGERFTEFYLLNSNRIASDYPTELKFGEEGKMIIGIINQEYENITYLLKVNFNESLLYEEQFFLLDNEKLEIPFTFKVTKNGENLKLEFLLYKDQQREAYRKLHLWINIS